MVVKRLMIVSALAVGLMLPATALADNSVLGGYGGSAATPVIKVQGTAAQKSTPPARPAATSGTLPFTGMDLAWFVVAGGALLVVGAGLRRFGSERQ